MCPAPKIRKSDDDTLEVMLFNDDGKVRKVIAPYN
jgi:hypothetical protein